MAPLANTPAPPYLPTPCRARNSTEFGLAKNAIPDGIWDLETGDAGTHLYYLATAITARNLGGGSIVIR